MARTRKYNIYYQDDYTQDADILTDNETMANSIEAALEAIDSRVDDNAEDIENKVDKVVGKDLSTNDYTTEEKNKLENIESGAEENVIENVKVNGTVQTVTNKTVDIPVPTKTSDITNDSGFIDKNVNDLTNYYKKSEIDSKVSSVYKYRGTVATYNNLPSTNLTIGDVYNVEDTGDNYAWTGTEWDKLGGDIDLSAYYTKIQTDSLLNNKEKTSNKTDTIDSSSTNTQYAGAKAVYDYVQGIVGDIGQLLDILNRTEV